MSDATPTFRTVSRAVPLRVQQRGAINDKRVPLSVFRPFALVVRYTVPTIYVGKLLLLTEQ